MSLLFKFPDGAQKVIDQIEVQLNLLAHAQLMECAIGSLCGGHGVCGGDRVKVTSKEGDQIKLSPLTADERRHLTPAEISEGIRLGCQCYPNDSQQNLIVEVYKT